MSTDDLKKQSGKRAKVSQGDADFIRNFHPVERGVDYGAGNYEFIRSGFKKLQGQGPKRGSIVSMSKKSLLKLMFTMQCTTVELGSMLTLTYPKIYPQDGEIVKADINLVAQKIRRLGWSYVWFLEFQKRGAPHVHFLLTPKEITPRGRAIFGLFWTERIATSRWFAQSCPPDKYLAEVLKMARFNCHPDTYQLLREQDGAKRYATMYATKERQKEVPKKYKNVGRFWGASRDVRPRGLEFDVTEDDVEKWLVENNHPASAYELVPRYVWALGQVTRKTALGKPAKLATVVVPF